MILRGGRLLQQYVVDNYVKIEAHRLRWFQSNQKTIRSELYQGLQDSLQEGEFQAGITEIAKLFIFDYIIVACIYDFRQYKQEMWEEEQYSPHHLVGAHVICTNVIKMLWQLFKSMANQTYC